MPVFSWPHRLIFLRLLLGLVIIPLSLLPVPGYPVIACAILGTGLLSDFLDGYLARLQGISNESLRRWDSTVDVIFFLGVAAATMIRCPDFFLHEKAIPLVILVGAEAMTYVVSYVRFRREVATHSIGAKIWTLFLFAALVEIILRCRSGWLFEVTFWFGLVTRLEIAGILLVLKTWTTDVPSLYHAFLLRKGKPIRRMRIFNG